MHVSSNLFPVFWGFCPEPPDAPFPLYAGYTACFSISPPSAPGREIPAASPSIPALENFSGKLHKEPPDLSLDFIKTLYCIKNRGDIIYMHKI